MSKILVLNTGSSSIKYQVLEDNKDTLLVICKGTITDLGGSQCVIKHQVGEKVYKSTNLVKDVAAGIEVIKMFLYSDDGVLKEENPLQAIGHRVVHGGSYFSKPILLDDKSLEILESISYLAPLHNTVNIIGVKMCKKYFPNMPQVAVFDTSFHQTLPEKAFRYAVPNALYEEDMLRVYGFHGTSHQYVSEQAITYLKNKGFAHKKMITIHLGNGCSMAAIQNGKCIDTTMGLSPLSGLIMGTRSGDIDPSIFSFLQSSKGWNVKEIDAFLNKKSGLLGLTGSMDMREVEEKLKNKNTQAVLAIEMFVYRIKKYIGAYVAALNGLDTIVFTAGIGENSDTIRQAICLDMTAFGIKIKQNVSFLGIGDLTDNQASVRTIVVPTNEELAIALQTKNVIQKGV